MARWMLLASAILIAVAGCRPLNSAGARGAPFPWHPADSPLAAESPAAEVEKPLAPPPDERIAAILAPRAETGTAGTPGPTVSGWSETEHWRQGGYRWQHKGLTHLGQQPGTVRDLQGALSADNPLVSATARIGLARIEGVRHRKPLLAILRSEPPYGSLPRQIHGAALETLARWPEAAADLDAFWETAENSDSSTGRQLHRELLQIAATDPDNEQSAAHFRHAIARGGPQVCTTAVELLGSSEIPLPVEIYGLIIHPDAALRRMTVETIGKRGDSTSLPALRRALEDGESQVRLAAIAALGEVGGEEARQLLRGFADSAEPILQSAGVAALLTTGDLSAASRFANHRNWRVRRVVAEKLEHLPPQHAGQAARFLIADRNSQVVSAALDAVANWPLEHAAPVFLQAARTASSPVIRRAAMLELAERMWPDEAAPARLVQEGEEAFYDSLEREWEARLPADDTQPSLDQLPVYDVSVLEALSELQRGRGLGRVNELLESQTPRRLAAETSELIWDLLKQGQDSWATAALASLVQQSPDEHAERIICQFAAPHRLPAVRQMAAEYCGRFPGRRHGELLRGLLQDTDEQVVVAACRALGACGGTHEDLAPLLEIRSDPLRLAAAAALCQLREQAGFLAMQQLALDDDPVIRAQAAAEMGRLGDRDFVDLLMPMLRGHPTAQLAAFKALEEIAGESDFPSAHASIQQRVVAWQLWYEDDYAAGASRSAAGPRAQPR